MKLEEDSQRNKVKLEAALAAIAEAKRKLQLAIENRKPGDAAYNVESAERAVTAAMEAYEVELARPAKEAKRALIGKLVGWTIFLGYVVLAIYGCATTSHKSPFLSFLGYLFGALLVAFLAISIYAGIATGSTGGYSPDRYDRE